MANLSMTTKRIVTTKYYMTNEERVHLTEALKAIHEFKESTRKIGVVVPNSELQKTYNALQQTANTLHNLLTDKELY